MLQSCVRQKQYKVVKLKPMETRIRCRQLGKTLCDLKSELLFFKLSVFVQLICLRMSSVVNFLFAVGFLNTLKNIIIIIIIIIIITNFIIIFFIIIF